MLLGSALAYAAIALGAFVEGEGVMLSAGALAHAGKIGWFGAMLAGACGSFVWGQVWFSAGRLLGPALIARRPSWAPRAAVVEGWIRRAGTWVVLGGRFVAGMGTVLPAVIGASGFPRARFVPLDVVGALGWSTVFSAVGFGVGRGLERLGGRSFGWEVVPCVLLVLVVQALLTRSLRRRSARNEERGVAGREVLPSPARRVIVTGDDFGLALPFNEAIELSYERGVLTTASLMLGEAASSDAIERARRCPGLCVGLHLALCEAKAVAPPAEIPRLVDSAGQLRGPVRAIVEFGVRAVRPEFRRELELEIRAQFAAFAATGLRFDHVSGHNNLHLHPAVLPILVRVARDFGVSAIRVPYEPFVPAWRASRTNVVARLCVWAVMGPWTAWARRRLEAEGFAVNDQIFGVFDCGAMTLERLLGIVRHLPPGTTEIHVHPATRRCPEIERTTPAYAHEAELQALLSPALRLALNDRGIELVAGYRELLSSKRPAAAPSETPIDRLVSEGAAKS